MHQALVADIAEALSVSETPLDRAVQLVHEQLAADRVSLVRFDDSGESFEVVATAGAELCSPGTRLPIATSSHYIENSEGRPFASTSLDTLATFDRSSDQMLTGRGLRSTCSFPLVRGRHRVGALNVSSYSSGRDFTAAADELAALGGMLTVALNAPADHRGPRVLICHDDPVYALGLARLCEEAGSASTIVHASLEAALLTIDAEVPDIVVCDNYLQGARVDEIVGDLRRAGAASALLVVASHDTPENATAAIRAGASAYIPRCEVSTSMALAIGALRSGRTLLPEGDEAGDVEALTPRELEVLRSLDEGLRIKQFAQELGISESTAKNHARNIFRKLGASSRTEALREARRQGIIG